MKIRDRCQKWDMIKIALKSETTYMFLENAAMLLRFSRFFYVVKRFLYRWNVIRLAYIPRGYIKHENFRRQSVFTTRKRTLIRYGHPTNRIRSLRSRYLSLAITGAFLNHTVRALGQLWPSSLCCIQGMQAGRAGSDEGTAEEGKGGGRQTCFITVRSGNGTESPVHSFRPIGLRIQVEITCSTRAKDLDVREHDLCDPVTHRFHTATRK